MTTLYFVDWSSFKTPEPVGKSSVPVRLDAVFTELPCA